MNCYSETKERLVGVIKVVAQISDVEELLVKISGEISNQSKGDDRAKIIQAACALIDSGRAINVLKKRTVSKLIVDNTGNESLSKIKWRIINEFAENEEIETAYDEWNIKVQIFAVMNGRDNGGFSNAKKAVLFYLSNNGRWVSAEDANTIVDQEGNDEYKPTGIGLEINW